MKGLIFTYALTYGGAVVSLFNPFYGLLIYICFAIIKPPALWHWSVPVGNYSRIIAVAFLLGWAMNGFGNGKLGAARSIAYALFGYWLWVTLSTAFSRNPSLGMPFVEYLGKIALPFVAGLTLVDSLEKIKLLLWTIVLSCSFLAYEANLAYLDGFNLEADRFCSLDNNSFSILMVTGFGLALSLGFLDTIWWRRWFFLGCAAAMAHTPMMSFSRGGMVGVGVATLAAFVVLPKTPRTWRLFGLALVLGSILAGPSVVNEFSTTFAEEEERDTSAQSRVDLWRDCVDTMVSNPLFGIGQDHWGAHAVNYGWNEGKEAHSLWFQSAAELGVPGVSFLLLFYLLCCKNLWWVSRETEDAIIQAIACGGVIAVVGFAVSASFVTVEGFELPYYVVLLGAVCVNYQRGLANQPAPVARGGTAHPEEIETGYSASTMVGAAS